MRVTFTVQSVYRPEAQPFAGAFDWDGENAYEAFLGEIFERGGNNPGREHFDGWQQPSVSVGDLVSIHLSDEGWGAVHVFQCEPVGWRYLDDDKVVAGYHATVRDLMTQADPEYGHIVGFGLHALAAKRDELRAAARARIEARRAAEAI